MAPNRAELLAAADRIATGQAGVIARAGLYAVGFTRGMVRAQIRAGRWRAAGSHAITSHTGPLTLAARHWVALIEGGPRACLDGHSALIASGLRGFDADTIRVSVPKGARIRRRRRGEIQLRETRRWRADDVVGTGIPRTRPAVAAVRGALWAKSDRQASLLLTMTIQQGLCSVEDLATEMLRIRRDRRRGLLHGVIIELTGGVRSISELDVARGCRERGLPTPTRQAVRRGSGGTYYLDIYWEEYGVVVEVDGIHHAWATSIVPDAIRHNSIALDGDLVLRLPVMGLRACPDEFFSQIETALRRRGWRGSPAA